jgi:pimeloyl-ACP methyl ester carboxylesterase
MSSATLKANNTAPRASRAADLVGSLAARVVGWCRAERGDLRVRARGLRQAGARICRWQRDAVEPSSGCCETAQMTHVVHDEFGISHTWGAGREVVFLSNPLADPVSWSGPAGGLLVDAGYRVTAFEHRSRGLDWRSAVSCIAGFISARPAPVWLLTAFPPEQLAQDDFVARMRSSQQEWAGRPDGDRRRRSAGFIASYQDRLRHLSALRVPCLVMGFGLDSDTYAARAREVAAAIKTATYVELPGLGHAAPVSAAECVWPHVIEFIQRHHHD